MRRMELDSANEILAKCGRILTEQHIQVEVAELTLEFHQVEMKFLYGDITAPMAYIEQMSARYPNYSILNMGRLVYEIACVEQVSARLADRFLGELENSVSYKRQPFMRMVRVRLLYQRGDVTAAFEEINDILTFSRLRHNRIRLVEAGLLKVFMLLDQQEQKGTGREVNNLMLEAVHYAHKDRIFMPFFLDRETLVPVLKELYIQSAKQNLIPAAEVEFIREAIAVCTPGAAAAKEDKELLSVRELEVLQELALGITNREIAEKLCISQSTVKTHVLSIFGKLGVSSRMMAVDAGRRHGLIT